MFHSVTFFAKKCEKKIFLESHFLRPSFGFNIKKHYSNDNSNNTESGKKQITLSPRNSLHFWRNLLVGFGIIGRSSRLVSLRILFRVYGYSVLEATF
jgi:hypothetical protein